MRTEETAAIQFVYGLLRFAKKRIVSGVSPVIAIGEVEKRLERKYPDAFKDLTIECENPLITPKE